MYARRMVCPKIRVCFFFFKNFIVRLACLDNSGKLALVNIVYSPLECVLSTNKGKEENKNSGKNGSWVLAFGCFISDLLTNT